MCTCRNCLSYNIIVTCLKVWLVVVFIFWFILSKYPHKGYNYCWIFAYFDLRQNGILAGRVTELLVLFRFTHCRSSMVKSCFGVAECNTMNNVLQVKMQTLFGAVYKASYTIILPASIYASSSCLQHFLPDVA